MSGQWEVLFLSILAANATLLVWNLIAAWRVHAFLRRAARV